MSDYWIDSPDNPFNQMDYTRGGGGYDNRDTHHSNDRRAHAMEGSGAAALPHFATAGIAQAAIPGRAYAVVGGDTVIRTTGPGSSGAGTSGGSGAGSTGVATSKGAGGSGAGSRLAFSGPLEMAVKDSGTEILVGGDWWKSNPWFSDTEEWGARYGEPGEWFGGVAVFGADAVFNIARGVNAVASPTNHNPIREAPPSYDNGWVSYDEGASWSFMGGTDPYLWDNGGRNPSLNPWR